MNVFLFTTCELTSNVISEFLRDSGHHISMTGNLGQALQLFSDQDFTFDLIICEILVPASETKDLLSEIKSLTPKIKIILFSKTDEFEEYKLATNFCAISLLKNPLRVSELEFAIMQAHRLLDIEHNNL